MRISIGCKFGRTRNSAVSLTDVGFGVSQILPVLVLLAWVDSGSTVILEQPEIHLHPAVQSGLADIIIEAATVRGVQVIVESHSEHLFDVFSFAWLRSSWSPATSRCTSVNFERTESSITGLDLNLFGEISNWPRGFFGDPLQETAAITRAAIQRKQQTDSEDMTDVLDVNVLLTANGEATHASLACQLAAIELLLIAQSDETLCSS